MKVLPLILVLLVLGAPVGAAAEAPGPMPRPAVSVEGDVVRLGDIFAGAGDKADIAVMRAPAPGRSIVLEAEWLLRAARAYGLDWRPLSRRDRVVLRRASVVLGHDDVVAALRPALAREGIAADAEIELSPRNIRLHLPVSTSGRLEIRDLMVDPESGRFTATLGTPAGGSRVAGRAYETVEVPVLARAVGRGEIIHADDVTWQTVRRHRLQTDVVVDPDILAGKAARFGLRPGVPVRERDIREPVVVARGAVVTMVLRRPGMTLTAQGRALDDGAQGEVIRVTNMSSNITVKARVEGPNRVAALPLSLASASQE